MKYKIILFLVITCNLLFSQITKVTYKNGIYGKDINNLKVSELNKTTLTAEWIKILEDGYKLNATVEYELIFDKESSFFSRLEKMSIDDKKPLFDFSICDKNYKNNLTKENLNNSIMSGELLNVIKSFEEFKWEITSETKKINGYQCYKATTTRQDLYNPLKNRQLTFNIVVWFTPDISTSFGPQGFHGLPGLVLEASQNGTKYIYATKIEFDVKDVKTVEKPSAPKTVSQKEFDDMISKNLQNIKNELGH